LPRLRRGRHLPEVAFFVDLGIHRIVGGARPCTRRLTGRSTGVALDLFFLLSADLGERRHVAGR
jgi:hypothetical protein